MRVDKYLWSIRIFKTRTLSAEICKKSHVRRAGNILKPSSTLSIGDELEVKQGEIKRVLIVTAFPKARVGAKLVNDYCNDITPESEYTKIGLLKGVNFEFRDRGSGRPTKKERRDIDDFKD